MEAELVFVHHETAREAKITGATVDQAQHFGYDLITAPITTFSFQDRVINLIEDALRSSNETPLPLVSPIGPVDSHLTPETVNSAIVGLVSPWIDVGSPHPTIAHISRQVLNLEVAYAAFCGINNILIHGPVAGSNTVLYARCIAESLGLGPYLSIQLMIPMQGELEHDHGEGVHVSEIAERVAAETEGDVSEGDDDWESTSEGVWESWSTWNTIRTVCDYNTRLSLALELPRKVPLRALQSRWFSEPVRGLVYPRTSFIRNAKGYPVLSKSHQQLFARFSRLRFAPWVVLSHVTPLSFEKKDNVPSLEDPTPAESRQWPKSNNLEEPNAHLKYLRHLWQNQPPLPPMERFGQGYQDYLQSPLQPLTDNLESITYEVFEKDPVKYEWYERAIAAALKDLKAKLGRDIIVAVAGSGRGPLVTRALQASRSTGISIQCWAVEKNPNAYVLLQRRNATDPLWAQRVHVVKTDMRHWSGPVVGGTTRKVDVLVSELLGSFGDNELSPECLDGVQHVLSPEHGINIPQSYTAHLTPIATPRLYCDLLSRPGGADKWEIPYVVMFHQHDYLCYSAEQNGQEADSGNETDAPVDIQQAWEFSHPIPASVLQQSKRRAGGTAGVGGWTGGDGQNEHNVRSQTLSFFSQHGGVCHGIAGYFESVLYSSATTGQKVEISTNPLTMEQKSKDMISWFPIFFPLKTPLTVPAQSRVDVTMWRQTDDRKVWYEWLVGIFDAASPVSLTAGTTSTGAPTKSVRSSRRSRRLAISELHSSRRNGCLM